MNHNDQPLSTEKRALLKIRELRRQLDQANQVGRYEPIAIVSMACRFPKQSDTPEKFWQTLLDQSDQVSEIPDDRWDRDAFHSDDPAEPGKMYVRKGVFLDQLDQMDPEFFGISPREATWVDPQQRLLLEVGWEAIERAGWIPEKIAAETGVFVGWMHNDYQNEASDSFLNLNPYIATGAAGSFLSGRLAYYLGLQGPSLAVDTACSSSLVALHLACQSLQRRDCDRALVGGVNAICSPTTNILTCKLQALSPTGHSRAFDASADGYLRGEGCGVVTIRRLADAQADGDPILGVIRGSAVGHNGTGSGMTVPNPRAQETVIRKAIERAGVTANEIAYLEAHGTGTELGDPIEMRAAASALASDRPPESPLLIGSVKTNIGHLEAAAGMAGLIKVLLAIQYQQIPGQLNFENPNPHIPWDDLAVRVLTDATKWPELRRRIAGVSAFGMSGTNAHVVVSAPDDDDSVPASRNRIESSVHSTADACPPILITVSGKSARAVEELAGRWHDLLQADPSLAVLDLAFTSASHRQQFEHRAAAVVTTRDQALQVLQQIASGVDATTVLRGQAKKKPRVGWQFTGQGSQFVGMAKQLYDHEPAFRQVIDRNDVLLAGWGAPGLRDVLFRDPDGINDTRWTQPAIFSIQQGLVRLLSDLGTAPDLVFGHSVGQYAAACVAGVMTWEDGLRLIMHRGRLISDLPRDGSMLAIFAPLIAVAAAIESSPTVSLAADNGTHVVVSGSDPAITAIERRFSTERVRTKRLTTSHAFHSELMDPVLQPFQSIAEQITFSAPQIPLICNVTGEVIAPGQVLDGEYWTEHIRQPVRFAPAVRKAHQIGCDVLLELGPQAVLTPMAAAVWNQPDGLVSCLDRGLDDQRSLQRAIGNLYVRGANPNLGDRLHQAGGKRVMLPTYPFQRRRFWGPDKPRASHNEHHTVHPLLGGKICLAGARNEDRYQSFVEPDSPSWLPDHQVLGQVVMPGAAYLEMAFRVGGGRVLRNLTFEQPLNIHRRTALQTVVRQSESDRAATVEIYSAGEEGDQWVRHFVAEIDDDPPSAIQDIDLRKLQQQCAQEVDVDQFYRKMNEIGLAYGLDFQTIHSLHRSDTAVLSRLKINGDVRGYGIAPPLVDGAIHSLASGLLSEADGDLFLPVGMQHARLLADVENEIWCYAQWVEPQGKTRTADLVLFDVGGKVVAQINGLKVQQVSRAALRALNHSGSEQLQHQMKWASVRLPAPDSQPSHWWLVHHRCDQHAERLSQELRDNGHSITIINVDTSSEFRQDDEQRFSLDSRNAEHWNQLFEVAFHAGGVPQGIAWLLYENERVQTADVETIVDEWPAETMINVEGLLHLLQTMLRRNVSDLRCGLNLVTCNGVATDVGQGCHPEQAKYWGLGRVIGAEMPRLRCRLIDVADDDRIAETLHDVGQILTTETLDTQFSVRDGKLMSPRIQREQTRRTQGEPFTARSDATYLITGGLGMLGREAAKWLAGAGAGTIVLVSRRQPDEDRMRWLNQIDDSACNVVIHLADMSSRDDVAQLFEELGNNHPPLAGVIHAAGVLQDERLENQQWSSFAKVLKPKILAAKWLHESTASMSLDFFVLYSSAASVLGSPGQSNYAMGNAYLDGLAWHRRRLGLPATSINWGPWSAGMADDPRIIKRLALQGITPLAVADAHAVLARAISHNATQITVMDVDWQRMQVGIGDSPMFQEVVQAAAAQSKGDSELIAKLRSLQRTAQMELVTQTMQRLLQEILSTPGLPETDRPLIEMGLDSLMAVEFGSELQQLLGGQFSVGPTMLFEHPTIDAITEHVLELVTESATEAKGEESSPGADKNAAVVDQREPIAVIGMSCRFPGADNVDQFWDNLINRVDSVGEIPEDRWDIDRFYSRDRDAGKMYVREGGFLDDIADFDAAFFNISDQEACWIDPQHRLLLENSYHALEDAGIGTSPLADANVGVFMGIMGQDYAFLPKLDDEEIVQAFQGAGLSHSAGVGRISYVFGFEGPSVAIDTASSSSLVALYQAMRSLQERSCNLALAGGVNAILAPVNSLLMSKAGLLAPDGRCKSFSADADGFGRGEGCGVVVLKRLSDAQRDGDRIMAVIRGGAVVHNGFSGGITAPNGKAQSRVINQALKDARVAPSQVQYLEAHGTGTEFGDPMEIAAAASVYGKGRSRQNPLLVGSVKANISHLEAAGGISGVIKTVLAIDKGVIPPQLHFDSPSRHIPWERMPVQIVDQQTPWPETEERLAGVTALGLVGTNAHLILASPPPSAAPTEGKPSPSDRCKLLVLSARSETALATLAKRYAAWLRESSQVAVEDFCRAAAVGRRHYDYRFAAVANSTTGLIDALERHLATDAEIGDRLIGAAKPKIGWVFGDRPPHPQVATERYDCDPVFRNSIDRLADGSSLPIADWFQRPFKRSDDSGSQRHVFTFVTQVAWMDVLRHWGIEPEVAFGFGLGGYAAACVAGCLSFQDALQLIEQDTSSLADDDFEVFADGLDFYPPKLPLVCGVSGDLVPIHRSLGGSYWTVHRSAPINFSDSCKTLRGLDLTHVIQFGTPFQTTLDFGACKTLAVPNNQVGETDWCVHRMIGDLFVDGIPVDFRQLPATAQPPPRLPLYPFERRRYWITEVSRFTETTPVGCLNESNPE